ncbi:MAG: nucleoside diphosphate kinase regulator [Bacillota bacterium]
MNTQPRIFVTDQDFHRLSALVSQYDTDAAVQLEEELGRAHIVPQKEIPANVVTMNSRLRYREESTGTVRETSLVYPQDANLDKGAISVLAPVGAALLGLSVGASIDWIMPNGVTKKITVTDVVFQPEAEGQFNL